MSSNVQALADKIEEIITNPEQMWAMSARNLKKSMGFGNDILNLHLREFYTHLRN